MFIVPSVEFNVAISCLVLLYDNSFSLSRMSEVKEVYRMTVNIMQCGQSLHSRVSQCSIESECDGLNDNGSHWLREQQYWKVLPC